jgi:plastocyanin
MVLNCNLAGGILRMARGRRARQIFAARRTGEHMTGSLRIALFVAAGVGLAASGGHAEEPGFTLSIRDHRFEPAELEIPAGQKIKLTVRNLDATPEEFESTELRREKFIAAGGEVSIYIGPLREGRYEFFGDFHPQSARGHIVAK